MKQEIARRQSNTDRVLALFRAQPREWIDATVFMELAGAMAWRTRISDARKVLEAEGGKVENRVRSVRHLERDADGTPARLYVGGPVTSEYRYLPYQPLGRSADVQIPQRSLFD